MPVMTRRTPVKKREENATLGVTINAKVGERFYIDLQRYDPKPGSAWLDQYDPSALTLNAAGFVAQYEGAGILWWEFTALTVGTTQVTIVDQPHLINPLFINRIYTVNVSAK